MYTGHIFDAICKVEKYIGDSIYQQFSGNEMMIDAVIRQFEIIGEAATNLSQDFKDSNPEIPCREMSDMRNVLIHNYAGVNVKIVWETYKNNLPKLKESIREMI